MVSCGLTTDLKIEVEKFLAHRSWRKYMAHFKRTQGEVKAGCRERVTASGIQASITGLRIDHHGVPGLGIDLSINQKSWVLINNHPHPGVLSKR